MVLKTDFFFENQHKIVCGNNTRKSTFHPQGSRGTEAKRGKENVMTLFRSSEKNQLMSIETKYK